MKLIGTLPKDTANGLDVRLSAMVNQPETSHLAVMRLRTASITQKVDTGEREPALRILGIEAVLSEDEEIAADLMRRAFQHRTGVLTLDLDAEEEGDEGPVRRYRKRPVVIEAIQIPEALPEGVDPAEDDYATNLAAAAVLDWLREHLGDGFDPTAKEVPASGWSIDPKTGVLLIATLEGVMQAKPGWWIIRGVAGEFYPCDPEIFEQTYVLASAPMLGAPIDVVRPEGFEAPETSAAKNIAAEYIRDAYDALGVIDSVGEEELGDQDEIDVADRIVENLIAAGWRPTVPAPAPASPVDAAEVES